MTLDGVKSLSVLLRYLPDGADAKISNAELTDDRGLDWRLTVLFDPGRDDERLEVLCHDNGRSLHWWLDEPTSCSSGHTVHSLLDRLADRAVAA